MDTKIQLMGKITGEQAQELLIGAIERHLGFKIKNVTTLRDGRSDVARVEFEIEDFVKVQDLSSRDQIDILKQGLRDVSSKITDTGRPSWQAEVLALQSLINEVLNKVPN